MCHLSTTTDCICQSDKMPAHVLRTLYSPMGPSQCDVSNLPNGRAIPHGRNRFGHRFMYEPLNTRIVLNQLNRLLVRCMQCSQAGIQRCHYPYHEKICMKTTVVCPAAGIKCTWTGIRDELAEHMKVCALEQVRPMIEKLQEEGRANQLDQQQMNDSIEKLQGQVNFLLKLVNKGNVMGSGCTMPVNNCRYRKGDSWYPSERSTCEICGGTSNRDKNALHACSGNYICSSCVSKQYNGRNANYADPRDDDSYNDSERYVESWYSSLPHHSNKDWDWLGPISAVCQ